MTSDESIIKIRKILSEDFTTNGMEELVHYRGRKLLEIAVAAYTCVPGRDMPDDDPRLSASMSSAIEEAEKPDAEGGRKSHDFASNLKRGDLSGGIEL